MTYWIDGRPPLCLCTAVLMHARHCQAPAMHAWQAPVVLVQCEICVACRLTLAQVHKPKGNVPCSAGRP